MMERRFGPLVVLLILGLFCVLFRAGTIQHKEHELWAQEAANLERSSRRLPYHRGKIRARGGEVLVEDEERYGVHFEWREFRRENPIGQVALAVSAWTGAPVALTSDPEELAGRALGLLEISREELEGFAHEDRGRAADVSFYLRRIVALERRADGHLRRLMAEREERGSVLHLAALACTEARSSLRGEEAIAEHVIARCEAALDDLEQLELSLGLEPGSLLKKMAACGEKVDDAVASRMFRRAVGFSAGRLEPVALAEWDLGWLRGSLLWGEEREADWRRRARSDWQGYMLTRIAPGSALEARLKGEETTLDHLLRILASTFAPLEGAGSTMLEPWGGGTGAPALFDSDPPTGSVEQPLFVLAQTKEVSEVWSATVELFEGGSGSLELGDWSAAADRAGIVDWEPPAFADEALTRWASGGATERMRLAQWIVARWASEWELGWARYQGFLRAGGDLSLRAERVESALNDRDYFLVEQGRRAESIEGEPSYEVVYLLTRYPERFRGFHVETRMQRTRITSPLGGEGSLAEGDPLWQVIGRARKTNLEEILVHRGGFDEFRDLRRQALRDETDQFELRQLVESLPRYDELHGADGIERLMDQTLSGRNGYLEYESLSALARRGGAPAVDWRPQHGKDVPFTIDLALQRAASETINHPEPPGAQRYRDEEWFAAPTGAICLITPEGEVLAAASAPNRSGGRPIAFRDGQGSFAHERTLRRHTALPIGSVFKPFVALWCLEQGLVTTEEPLACLKRRRRGTLFPGYRSVDCHSSVGHGNLSLASALRVSCNAYFAQLGDRLESGEALAQCARTFGFDAPTGVNELLGESAIREDWENPSFRKAASFGHIELERGANGLMVLEGVPLQVARAYAGLATGSLPALSFVVGSGGTSQPLPISLQHLETVRSALREVARSGTAKHLRGLDVAAKTGSADYRVMSPQIRAQLVYPAGSKPAMRKHTWVAGWTPAHDPRLIFVIYLHDIGVTSTYSSVFVARQLLERPEVRAFLAEDGS